MPIYDFLCRDCEHTYEDLVGADEVLDQTCPRCRSGEVVKQYSSFALGAGVRSSSTTSAEVTYGTGGACLPGPASAGRSGGGCCGGGCGGCG
jgi:putative FmdB family regulatory protein